MGGLNPKVYSMYLPFKMNKRSPMKVRIRRERENLFNGFGPVDYKAFRLICINGEEQFLKYISGQEYISSNNFLFSNWIAEEFVKYLSYGECSLGADLRKAFLKRIDRANKEIELGRMPNDKFAFAIFKMVGQRDTRELATIKNQGSLFPLGTGSAGLTEVKRLMKKKDFK